MVMSIWESIKYNFAPTEEQQLFDRFMRIIKVYPLNNIAFNNLEITEDKNLQTVRAVAWQIEGSYPAHLAALNGNGKVVEFFLLNKEAFNWDINEIDQKGCSILHAAAQWTIRAYRCGLSAGWHVIEQLIIAGVDLKHRNADGKTIDDLFDAEKSYYLSETYLTAKRIAFLEKDKHLDPSQENYLLSEKKRLGSRLLKIKSNNSSSSNSSSSPESVSGSLPIEIQQLIRTNSMNKVINETPKHFKVTKLIPERDMNELRLVVDNREMLNDYLNEIYDEQLANQELDEQEEIYGSFESDISSHLTCHYQGDDC